MCTAAGGTYVNRLQRQPKSQKGQYQQSIYIDVARSQVVEVVVDMLARDRRRLEHTEDECQSGPLCRSAIARTKAAVGQAASRN